MFTSNGWAEFENCLFVGNLSNTCDRPNGGPGYGALTVFPGCRATVSRCTFTGNRNGVDDRGTGSTYQDSIFWRNDLGGGASPAVRYDLTVGLSEGVAGCYVGADVSEAQRMLSNSPIPSARPTLASTRASCHTTPPTRASATDHDGLRRNRLGGYAPL